MSDHSWTTDDGTLVPVVDPSLWFEPGCCPGPHFLYSNPHTFPGRMNAWCPTYRRQLAVSKQEIERCSVEAVYWMRGFLMGSEPDPPLDEQGYGIEEDDDPRMLQWRRSVEHYRETGQWVDQP